MGVSVVMPIESQLCVVGKEASSQHKESSIARLQKVVMVKQQRIQKNESKDGRNFSDQPYASAPIESLNVMCLHSSV